jgi:2-dehydro-3-deoxygalactonokinase
VLHAQQAGSVLRSAFSVRTLALFDRMSAPALASYLSGLVIGEELRLRHHSAAEPVLVGSSALTGRYSLALQALGVGSRSLGTEAAWRGLWALARSLEQE